MPAKRIRDVLERAKQFHQKLRDHYHGIERLSQDERIRLLLDYMQRHERNIERALKGYTQEAAEGVLDTWLPFVPDNVLDRVFRTIELRPEMTPAEIIGCALELDRALVELYEVCARESSATRVQELFDCLLEMERGKDYQYARSLFDDVVAGEDEADG